MYGRIVHHVHNERQRHPLVLSVHSQGSILAFVVLAPMPAADLQQVALVTYGSPISTIYGTFFPAYLGPDEVEKVRAKLPAPGAGLLGWRNFYRATDPIGGPVFLSGPRTTPEADCQLDDPFRGDVSSPPSATTPPLERDRPPWTQLAIHSYYAQEPVLKRWVRELKAAMGSGPP